ERLAEWLAVPGIKDDPAGPLFPATRSARGRGRDGFAAKAMTTKAVEKLIAPPARSTSTGSDAAPPATGTLTGDPLTSSLAIYHPVPSFFFSRFITIDLHYI